MAKEQGRLETVHSDGELRVARPIRINPRLNSLELALERYYRTQEAKPGAINRMAETIDTFDPNLQKAAALERKDIDDQEEADLQEAVKNGAELRREEDKTYKSPRDIPPEAPKFLVD